MTVDPVIDDGLDLIFRVFINEFWGRAHVVWAVRRSLHIRS